LDIAAGGWNDPRIFQSLDYGNVQGYDLHGTWDPALTGHQGNLFDDPADTRAASSQFSVDKGIKAYIDAGIAPEHLGMGLAMFGRGWTGASQAEPWGPAAGAGPGTWEPGMEDYDKLKNIGASYYDANVGASWRYDGNQWWSLDDAQSVSAKADYVRSKGLGGVMWWDTSGDRDGELPAAAFAKLGTGVAGPVSGGAIINPTPTPDLTVTPEPNPTATPDTTATPGTTATPNPDSADPSQQCAAAWSSTLVYLGGGVATYGGHSYEAKWWTQGDTPGVGEWAPLGGSGRLLTTSLKQLLALALVVSVLTAGCTGGSPHHKRMRSRPLGPPPGVGARRQR
jgi:chitinase